MTLEVPCALSFLNLKFLHRKPVFQVKITVVVVQKRHHTRFFDEKIARNNGKGKGGGKSSETNIKPGTIIDRDVVHPYNR